MALPSVLTEDVLSPSGVQAAGAVASNLQQIADRSAQIAMAKAKLDAETKIQQKQLDAQQKQHDAELKAKADQYTQYQDFQAKEAEKQRAFEEKQNAEREALADKRNKEVFSRQDEAIRQDNVWKSKELEIRANKARLASEEASKLDSQLEETSKQREANQKKIAALEFEVAVSENKQGEFVKFATEEGAALDASRIAAAQAITDETVNAIVKSQTDVASATKSGFAGVAQGSAEQMLTGVSPSMAPAVELGSQAVSHIADWLGLEYVDPAHANAINDVGMMANHLVNNLAPKLAGISPTGTAADIHAGLSNFMASAVKAQQALASDGAIKGADEEKIMAEFSKHAEALQGLIGADGVQALVKGLGTATGTFDTVTESKMSKGEVAARKKAFNDLGRIKDVFEIARNQEGSKLSGSDYERPVSKVFGDILNAYAKTSFNSADFADQLKRIGVKPSQVQNLMKKLEETTFTPPEALAQKMKELQDQQEELKTFEDMISRKTTNKAVKAGADAELQGISELRNSLGL